jgi:hypothetical protein
MRSVREGAAAVFLCSAILLSMLATPPVHAASSTTTSTVAQTPTAPPQPPASLAIFVVPPLLPADGGSYPAVVVSLLAASGRPTISLKDTQVSLTSANQGVGQVTSLVTIPRGAAFAVANFTTTAAAGNTSVSALSPGLNSSSTTVATVHPGGDAARLAIIPVPSAQLLTAGTPGVLLIETLDSAGLPARAGTDLPVTLSSSGPSVTLPQSDIVVPAGSIISSVPYDVGQSPGTATVSCSAPGLRQASSPIDIEGSSPFSLHVTVEPNPLPTSTTGRLVVTVTDAQGEPVPAPASIPVAISSSNTTLADPGQTATISQGQIYASVTIDSGAAPGMANITASSPGLTSDFAPVNVVTAGTAQSVKLTVAPALLLSDNATYQSVMVALADSGGGPARAAGPVVVTLSSAPAAVGTVSGSVTIPQDQSYAVASFTTTFVGGTATITASAQNLQSATASMSVAGSSPSKLVAQVLVPSLPADGGSYAALEVSLQDAAGAPAVAPADTLVSLQSTGAGVASVAPTVTIMKGESFAIAEIGTGLTPGSASLNATASGYPASTAVMTTVPPSPSQLGIYLAPRNGIQALWGGEALVAIQVQGAGAYPSTAQQDTPVTISGSNGSMLAEGLNLTIHKGQDCAWLVLDSKPGVELLTASASGLQVSSAPLALSQLPVTAVVTSSVPVVPVGGAASVTVQVEVVGSPLEGANVTVSSTSGTVLPSDGVTDATGSFSSTFVAEQTGATLVTAVVQDALLGNLSAGTNILVTSASGAAQGGSAPKGAAALGTILPVVVVLMVVVIVAFGVRRLMKKRVASVGEEDSSGEQVSALPYRGRTR